ncbi:MAG: 50S ribosomal protein L10 [Candidatus Pacearchaeota archaeon]|jgi:large subunit ribosomal protein L10
MAAKKPKSTVNDKTAHVSERKKNVVAELSDLIKNKKTILVASIKNIPSSQYQEISKKLRGKAVVKVPKKNIIFMALEKSGVSGLKELESYIKDSSAILFSDEDSFDLAAELINKKSPAKAKSGQEAMSDIEIPEGPTDLIPGPAISELGALGIKIQIEKGKITIKEPKVIAKTGEKISAGAADMLNKLGILPFSIGFVPVAAFDLKEKKLYLEIRIDREKTISDLKTAFSKSLVFAVKIAYPNKETIKFLIAKAGMQERAIEKLTLTQTKSEEVNTQQNSQEV